MSYIDMQAIIVSLCIFIFIIYITTPKYKIIFKYHVTDEENEQEEHIRSESIECPDSLK